MQISALIVFLLLFGLVTVVGFVAAHWRKADLNQLHEWGLGGRRFGGWVTWFLLGGDLYSAYTFVAVPALVFGAGAIGFFAMPYTIIAYPLVFAVLPRLWRIARRHDYVTGADFVRGRYGSRLLGLLVAITGILATTGNLRSRPEDPESFLCAVPDSAGAKARENCGECDRCGCAQAWLRHLGGHQCALRGPRARGGLRCHARLCRPARPHPLRTQLSGPGPAHSQYRRCEAGISGFVRRPGLARVSLRLAALVRKRGERLARGQKRRNARLHSSRRRYARPDSPPCELAHESRRFAFRHARSGLCRPGSRRLARKRSQ